MDTQLRPVTRAGGAVPVNAIEPVVENGCQRNEVSSRVRAGQDDAMPCVEINVVIVDRVRLGGRR